MKHSLTFATTSLFVLLAAAGCSGKLSVGSDPADGGGPATDSGSTPGADGGGQAGGCTSDQECGAGSLCGFATADACVARGTCFKSPGGFCDAFQAGCACDGTTINIICLGLPSGYSPKPLVHTGECSDSGSEAACKTSADCGATGICGFPTADACTATGECFPRPSGECDGYSPGCACDTTEINLACNGLPSGYAPKPLYYTGQCHDPGAKTCATDADCGNGICGFKKSDTCLAKGQCFPAPGQTCGAFVPGCACDGTDINLACNGLPEGYVPKPWVHDASCTTRGD